MNETTFYYDKNTPKYTNYNSIHLYIGQDKFKRVWLRFRIQYTGDDWLFIENYSLKTEHGTFTIPTTDGEVKRDHDSGEIWEWYDVELNRELYGNVLSIISSKNSKLRHNGTQYYKDRTITDKEKKGMQNILDAYEVLGGKIDY